MKDLFPQTQSKDRGRVKWFSEKKGYGFIVPENSEDDVFFHFSAIQQKGFKTVADGQLVEFIVEETNGGKKKASYVRIILL